jgi:hypothetical protein
MYTYEKDMNKRFEIMKKGYDYRGKNAQVPVL